MNNKTRIELLLCLFFVSGFSGLIYESVWSHYVKLFLGHAAYAQTLVLVVFIGGLALGAWLCSLHAERIANPLRGYAIVEAATGLLGLVFHGIFNRVIDWGYASLLPAACEAGTSVCIAQWGLSALLLAPQSILLGMTFPLMTSAVLRLRREQAGHDIATLYFINSLGAVLGVLASAFLLIPNVGLPGTLSTAGIANIALAIVAYFVAKTPQPPLAPAASVAPHEPPSAQERRLVLVMLATAMLTGLSSFIYEIVWIRMLSLVLGASTHAFELMLATFILGLALGGLRVRNAVDRVADPVRFLAIVQIVMGLAAAATVPLYNGSFDLMAWLLSSVSRTSGGFVLFSVACTLIALLVMLPATFCAGMTLPLITFRLLQSRAGERSLGLVYAVNTLGAILGVVLTVHVLMTSLGLHGALVVGAAIDVGLGVVLLLVLTGRRGRATWAPALAGVVALVAVAVLFDVDQRRSASGVFRTGVARLPPATKTLFHEDGKTATVDVIDFDGVLSIRTNGKSDASIEPRADRTPSLDEFTMALLGLLPMGHKPDAATAAVIGFGSGMSTTVLLGSPALKRVDTIEIEPAMVRGATHFRPLVSPAFDDPRSHVVIDDAKSYFARGKSRYDIIVSEPSNPWVSGVSSLFTEEFYRRLSEYLNEGGVLSQWLHTYEMDSQTLASILAAVSKTFPEYAIYSSLDSDLVLIARKGGAPGRFDGRVLGHAALAPMLARLKLSDPDVVNRRLIARWSTLGPYVATFNTTPNSDYFPIVDQRASRTRFTQTIASDLSALQTAAVPLLEMFDAEVRVPAQRIDAIPVTVVDGTTMDAWTFHDVLLGQPLPAVGASQNVAESYARLARHWALECPANLAFERVVTVFTSAAERVNARLTPAAAMEAWQWLAQSPCGRRLPPAAQLWMELLASVAHRDAAQMAVVGQAALKDFTGSPNEASEYAALAAAAGLLCTGKHEAARELLDKAPGTWIRRGTRAADLRFLEAAAKGKVRCAAR